MTATTPAKKRAPRKAATRTRTATDTTSGPHIPAGVRLPQDRPRSAAQLEAEGAETVTVEWRGQEYVVPADLEDWPYDVTMAFEQGRAMTGVQGLLGPDQWALVARQKPTTREVGELFAAIGDAMGLEGPGE